jgi:hypothetical protein
MLQEDDNEQSNDDLHECAESEVRDVIALVC